MVADAHCNPGPIDKGADVMGVNIFQDERNDRRLFPRVADDRDAVHGLQPFSRVLKDVVFMCGNIVQPDGIDVIDGGA